MSENGNQHAHALETETLIGTDVPFLIRHGTLFIGFLLIVIIAFIAIIQVPEKIRTVATLSANDIISSGTTSRLWKSDTLKVHTILKSSDFQKVHVGQAVQIFYPLTTHALKATISGKLHVATINDKSYVQLIILDEDLAGIVGNGCQQLFIPPMTINLEIFVGKKRLFNYFWPLGAD
jgi:hypothetical protein